MPDIRDPNTVQAIAIAYIANGRNKEQALVDAGYAESYARTGHCAQLYARTDVKLAIHGQEVKYAEENGYSVAVCQAEYEQARVHAVALNQPSAEVSAITGKARLYGMDKDHEIGSKEAAVPVTAEQTEEYRAMARAAIKLRLSKGA
jgi:hypothetical protein